MSEVMAASVHSDWDEGRMLSPKTVLNNRETYKQSFLSQLSTSVNGFTNWFYAKQISKKVVTAYKLFMHVSTWSNNGQKALLWLV